MNTSKPSYDNLRIFDLYLNNHKHFNQKDTLNSKKGDKWHSLSIDSIIKKGNAISNYLLGIGIKKGDRIAVVSTSRFEWHLIDFAVTQIGAINVPIYANINANEYEYIFKESKPLILFVSDSELFEGLKSVVQGKKYIKEIISFDAIDGFTQLEDIIAKQSSADDNILKLRKDIKQEDIATIIYTSGTTGSPKGVVLTHLNIISNVIDSLEVLPVSPGDVSISFLPLNHVFERIVTYIYIYTGCSIYFVESLDLIGEIIKEVRPMVFSTVPRLLEKVYDKIMEKGSELKGIKKSLFFWSVGLAEQYDNRGKNSLLYRLRLSIARKLIFSKWQAALGGRIKLIVSGSAACQTKLLKIFNAAGVPVREGYGLTETSPVVCVNPYNEYILGYAGKIISEVKVKIADDGEILVKGPNVTQGYYKNPKATKELFTSDGWLKTGDVGELTENHFLKITDRKKEIFKTSGGKYIAPQYIESQLKTCKHIEQVFVIGENKKFPAAIIQPNWENIEKYCLQRKIPFKTKEDIVNNDEVIEMYYKEVDKINEQLSNYEKIKKIEIAPDTWTVEDGQLTPTLKLKRRVLSTQYKHMFTKIYS